MTVARGSRGRVDTDRWLKPIVAVLAIAAGVFGIGPFVFPELGAQASGFVGKDIFIYRLTGAASFGFTVALVVAWRDGWRGLRIPIAGMAVFAIGSIVATVAAIAAGEGTWIVYLVLVASAIFLCLQVLLLTNPPASGASGAAVGSGRPDVAEWVVLLVAFGALGAAATGGLALILGGSAGSTFGGYTGTDSVIYRQVGAATLGTAFSGLLVIRARRWLEIRGGLWGGYAFNGLSLIAAVIEIARGGGNLMSVGILGVSVVMTVGLAVVLRRGGR